MNDPRLSFRARGLLAWFQQRDADGRTLMDAAVAESPVESRAELSGAMVELLVHGHVRAEIDFTAEHPEGIVVLEVQR